MSEVEREGGGVLIIPSPLFATHLFVFSIIRGYSVSIVAHNICGYIQETQYYNNEQHAIDPVLQI